MRTFSKSNNNSFCRSILSRSQLRGSHLDVLSLALIGNASGRTVLVGRTKSIRGVFDKETRRKPLARRTRAYGIWMAAWSRVARPEGTVGVRELAGNHEWSGERMERKVGKGEIARKRRHECVGVLRHI